MPRWGLTGYGHTDKPTTQALQLELQPAPSTWEKANELQYEGREGHTPLYHLPRPDGHGYTTLSAIQGPMRARGAALGRQKRAEAHLPRIAPRRQS